MRGFCQKWLRLSDAFFDLVHHLGLDLDRFLVNELQQIAGKFGIQSHCFTQCYTRLNNFFPTCYLQDSNAVLFFVLADLF